MIYRRSSVQQVSFSPPWYSSPRNTKEMYLLLNLQLSILQYSLSIISLAENWFEENYTKEEKKKLTKCVEVFDITNLFVEVQTGVTIISQEYYCAIKEAINKGCLFSFAGNICQCIEDTTIAFVFTRIMSFLTVQIEPDRRISYSFEDPFYVLQRTVEAIEKRVTTLEAKM